jgi:DNA-binding transcriptional LysR family regulator
VGLTIVPTLTLYQFRRPTLTIRAIEDNSFKREVFVLTRKNKLLSRPARAMFDMVTAHVAGLKHDG